MCKSALLHHQSSLGRIATTVAYENGPRQTAIPRSAGGVGAAPAQAYLAAVGWSLQMTNYGAGIDPDGPGGS